MKRLVFGALVALAFATTALVWFRHRTAVRESPPPAGAPADAPADEKTWYTCSMHPEIVRDAPGPCPRCGMTLRPIPPDRAAAMGLTAPPADTGTTAAASAAPAERTVLYWKSSMIPGEIHQAPGKDSMGMDLIPVYADEVSAGGTIRVDPVTEQNMGVRVATVTRGPLRHTVRAVAYVDYDETTLSAVTTKVDGWIERLYVEQTGAQVHGGDPLFELYSPELFSAQEEYLAAIRNRQTRDVPAVPASRLDSESLVRAARQRLEYFDISDAQIRELERTRRVRKTLTIKAPFTGIVTHKNVVEGQKVTAGADLFRIADLSTVWVIAKLYEQDAPFVQLGQEALMTLAYLPGRTYRGRVTYVYPYLETGTREISVRMEFHNPGYELKPGMYATVTLSAEAARDATLVPDMAVLETGTRAVVFVRAGPGRFEAREVRLGLRGDDNRVQVLSGLAPDDVVVVSGQFLLDSESRLREAALKMIEPKQPPAAPAEAAAGESHEHGAGPAMDHPHAHAAGAAAGEPHEHGAASAGTPERTYYACPMPEHVDTLYDQPGTCPICGMRLVPVRRVHGHVETPRIAYWTCPMPEHRHVHEPGPGRCPICGMSLIPVPEAP